MENSTYQKALAETTQMYEKKIVDLVKQLEDEHAHFEEVKEQLYLAKKLLRDQEDSIQVYL